MRKPYILLPCSSSTSNTGQVAGPLVVVCKQPVGILPCLIYFSCIHEYLSLCYNRMSPLSGYMRLIIDV